MKKIREYISIGALITIAFSIISGVIHVISVISVGFSEKFNLGAAAFIRRTLASITDLFPFSLGEILVIISPIIIFSWIFGAFKLIKADKKKRIRFLCSLLAFISFFYSAFVFTFAASYRVKPLDEKLSLDRKEVSAAELAETLDVVIAELNSLEGKIEYSDDFFSVMPYDFNTLGDKLVALYSDYAENNDYISKSSGHPKAIMLSEPMTYTHIAGVYTFFTGEANLNVNYPEFIRPYTTAHEMAHQRGVAREDEANFVAFLICISSDDDYIKYSGYLNMFEYLGNALYSADRELYRQEIEKAPLSVLYELSAYSDFFDKYRDSTASKVSDKINDGYLVSQGQKQGTLSYGLVVDLCVAYYKTK